MHTVFFVMLSLLAGCDNEAQQMLMTCEGGNHDACYRDGVKLVTSARPNYSEARRKLSSACMSVHHPGACHELGKLVRDAHGGPADKPRAADLFGIACRGEVEAACIDHALALYKGDGIKEDPERAISMLSKDCASEKPTPEACRTVGDAYRDEVGIERDRNNREKALEMYNKACELKLAKACVDAGSLIHKTPGRVDVDAVATKFSEACELDAHFGCYDLAELHMNERRWEKANPKDASINYQKACNTDPTHGCFEAAELMAEGKVKAREGEIESLYNLACEHGNSEACMKRNADR